MLVFQVGRLLVALMVQHWESHLDKDLGLLIENFRVHHQ